MSDIDFEKAYYYAKELEMDVMFDKTSKQNLARAYLALREMLKEERKRNINRETDE